MSRLTVHQGSSFAGDAEQAVAEVAEQIGTASLASLIFFCSPRYDLDHLGRAIARHFSCPAIGCTTAGEIISGHGYREGGIVAVGLESDELIAHPRLIEPLDRFDAETSVAFTDALKSELSRSADFEAGKMFGFLLVDGLSMLEEQVTASLYTNLKGVQIFGGSPATSSISARPTSITMVPSTPTQRCLRCSRPPCRSRPSAYSISSRPRRGW